MPAILEGTTEVKPDGDTLAKFLVINGELRRKNNAKIASFAAQTKPELLWRGAVFHPFGNTAVESAFADHRTYIYKGKEVDQQVHLGFDLASFAGTPDRLGQSRHRRSSPTSSASTATASSSITGWACSRSTATSRRST